MSNHKTACQVDPDPWFSNNRKDQAAAKAACQECSLREPCEQIGWEQEHGTWGGLSELDRRKLDPEAYAQAQKRAASESMEFDAVIAVERLRKQRAREEEQRVHEELQS